MSFAPSTPCSERLAPNSPPERLRSPSNAWPADDRAAASISTCEQQEQEQDDCDSDDDPHPRFHDALPLARTVARDTLSAFPSGRSSKHPQCR